MDTTKELRPDMILTVNGIIGSGYVPPLHAYLPLRRCSLRVDKILLLLEKNITVLLTDEQIHTLYFFIKKYNMSTDSYKKGSPKMINAENVLYKMLYKKAVEEEKEDDKHNPFVVDDSTNKETDDIVRNMYENNAPKLSKMTKKENRKFRMYDVFKTEKKERNDFESMKEMIDFGDVDFEM